MTEIAVKEIGHSALLSLLIRFFETVVSVYRLLFEFLGKLFQLLCAEEVDIGSQTYTDKNLVSHHPLITLSLCKHFQVVLLLKPLSKDVLIDETLLLLPLNVVVGDEFEAARTVVPL